MSKTLVISSGFTDNPTDEQIETALRGIEHFGSTSTIKHIRDNMISYKEGQYLYVTFRDPSKSDIERVRKDRKENGLCQSCGHPSPNNHTCVLRQ